MTVVNFDNHFRDRMGEIERGHIEHRCISEAQESKNL